jgi:adenylylsulfate kinase-like enzyme
LAPAATITGRIIWITGVAGSGKTALGVALCARWPTRPSPIHLDGDRWREILGPFGVGYEPAQRLAIGAALARLSMALAAQGASVVVSTISCFAEIGELLAASAVPVVRVHMRAQPGVLAARRPDLYPIDSAVVDRTWPYTVEHELHSDQGLSAEQLADRLLA